MTNSGYSGTPLLKKLGINPGMKVLLLNEPENYFELLETNISNQLCQNNEIPGLVHLFARNKIEFEAGMKKLKFLYQKHTGIIIWVSWYKKSAGIPTDITEDVVRDFALRNRLVDVKVCAVSDLWSALKLVIPIAKR